MEQGGGKSKLPAIRWLLDAISGALLADDHRVFRIENLELLDALGLKPREGSFRYSLNDFRDKFDELQKQIDLADAQPEDRRSLYQKAVIRLAMKLNLYTMLIQSFRSPELPADGDKRVENISQIQLAIERMRAAEAPHAVPPSEVSGRWTPLMEAKLRSAAGSGDQSAGQSGNCRLDRHVGRLRPKRRDDIKQTTG